MMPPQEKGGDFSNSLNISDGLRTIYDPWSSTLTPGGWTMSWIYNYRAGDRMRFGIMDVVGNPALSSPDKWA
jgi:hypothetical protein